MRDKLLGLEVGGTRELQQSFQWLQRRQRQRLDAKGQIGVALEQKEAQLVACPSAQAGLARSRGVLWMPKRHIAGHRCIR
jgi:hypothetical protein